MLGSIPLGGNRKGGSVRTAVNIAVVMLLGGLWHGASWNFIIWGGLHGLYLGYERILGKQPFYTRLPTPFKITLTFILVTIAWVFFRAENLAGALLYLKSMFGMVVLPDTAGLLGGQLYTPYNLLAMGVAGCIVWGGPQSWDWSRKIGSVKLVILTTIMVVTMAVLSVQSYNPFIYFNF